MWPRNIAGTRYWWCWLWKVQIYRDGWQTLEVYPFDYVITDRGTSAKTTEIGSFLIPVKIEQVKVEENRDKNYAGTYIF